MVQGSSSCNPLTLSPKHNPPTHINAPRKVQSVHCANFVHVVNVQNTIKGWICAQNNQTQLTNINQTSLVGRFPSGTLEGSNRLPTVPQAGCLATSLPHWRACAVSPWVERTVAMGYRLQFRLRPPRFRSVVNTEVAGLAATALRGEINNLLAKNAIQVVPASEVNKGWYSRYFVIPKKGGDYVLSWI